MKNYKGEQKMDKSMSAFHQAISQNPAKYTISDDLLSQEISKVYGWMFFGLMLTAATAFYCASNPSWYIGLIQGFSGIVIMLSPLALVFYLSARIHTMTASKAGTFFLIFSILMGLSLGTVFLVYSLGSIFSTFIVTSLTFLIMAFYGYTTKTDLTQFGKIFMFALVGLIISMVINIFLGSSTFDMIISGIGVLLFTGLIAYDTQKIKEAIIYSYGMDGRASGRGTIMGALALYLDFINLFLFLLRFLGNRD